MMNSRIFNLKINFIRAWPFRNKLRIANLLIKKEKYPDEYISFLSPKLLLYTSLSSYLEYIVFCTGDYEPEINFLLKSYLREGDTALDIGANIGIHSLRMANYVGNEGKVYSFEPIGVVINKFKKNIALNQICNIYANQLALADYQGNTTIQYKEEWYNQGVTSLSFTETGNYEVRVEIGDDYLQQFNIDKLKLIKIDVEGFEWPVIKGLKKTIALFKPVIIFEFMLSGTNLYLKTDPNEILQFFTHLNYLLYAIDSHHLSHINSATKFPITGNIIAIPQ